jgi:hypothetical protein
MSLKNCNPELSKERVGDTASKVSPMDMVLGWVLVILIIGGVVVYRVRTEMAGDRPVEPRRRRPF